MVCCDWRINSRARVMRARESLSNWRLWRSSTRLPASGAWGRMLRGPSLEQSVAATPWLEPWGGLSPIEQLGRGVDGEGRCVAIDLRCFPLLQEPLDPDHGPHSPPFYPPTQDTSDAPT